MHLYAESSAQLELLDGRRVGILQRTEYPWDGRIGVEIRGKGDFTLFLRVPDWSDGEWSLELNGEFIPEVEMEYGYLKIMRGWSEGDVLQLEFPMSVRVMESHPSVKENVGRVALLRGPLLYCLEGVDHPGLDLDEIVLPQDASCNTSFHRDLFDGVVTIETKGMVQPPSEDWGELLYRRVEHPSKDHPAKPVPIKAIPYYAWGNREAGQMQVWTRRCS
jgi:DUF1680 family protein